VLSYDNIEFDYDPYPIGVASPVVEDRLYQEMLRCFPPIELFNESDYHGRKYFLSKKHNRREFEAFVMSQPVWREFRRYVKSGEFIFGTLDMLRAHNIDLGLTRANMSLAARSLECLKHLAGGHLPNVRPALTGRLEFSALPADGGMLLPHTDTAKKMITLVISMVGEGEWSPEFGGGTEVMKPSLRGGGDGQGVRLQAQPDRNLRQDFQLVARRPPDDRPRRQYVAPHFDGEHRARRIVRIPLANQRHYLRCTASRFGDIHCARSARRSPGGPVIDGTRISRKF
jgi:hypothetical protein